MSQQAERRFAIAEGVEGYIVRERYNKLIGRRELEVMVDHMFKGTPRRLELREAIARLFGVDPSLVIVKKIVSEYGWGKSRAKVFIYDSMDRLKIIEPEHMLRKHGLSKG
ncbi:MAG: 30S ribosomal protein S24e [Thermoprotei archaeon]|mgnify:CR=1 FL=1|nr:MAG: 30S ribosomal protein S24e [Thermoprotei archaeon]